MFAVILIYYITVWPIWVLMIELYSELPEWVLTVLGWYLAPLQWTVDHGVFVLPHFR